MHAIRYAGDTILTGDDIASALLAYTAALASRGTAAAVQIPVRGTDGIDSHMVLVVGVGTEISAHPVATNDEEVRDSRLVDELRVATLGWRPISSAPDIGLTH